MARIWFRMIETQTPKMYSDDEETKATVGDDCQAGQQKMQQIDLA